ncbi:DUF6352 family protein [Bradyrhizobium sp. ARR65]|uniref:DUF6352 family protein n=1 Tax=Bradyrhizobium sp. ARR65 TaxID=1040989 RepID=UPI000467B5CE|nr:DUF6352 family protein [Bradyrhizobium sp. ARR65]
MRDFWIASGHHLLDRDASGGLVVTDEFLKAYFVRPELRLPDDACPVERRLHRDLLDNPRMAVGADELAAMADADARENWQFVLAFRDLLLRHPTLEAAYLALIRSASVNLPPLFLDQLVHVILRNALDGCDDPFTLRAGELFFRQQRLITHEHSLLLADDEMIGGRTATPVMSLMSMLGATVDGEIDVLSEENADSYWQRSDQFDMALDLSGTGQGRAAIAEAMTHLISHLLGIDVTIEPITELRDARLTWYVGLDAEASRIGDRLWHGEPLDDRTAGRVLALFRLTFGDADLAADTLDHEPVYLILAMTSDRLVRMKPQNLLTGLPIKHPEATA